MPSGGGADREDMPGPSSPSDRKLVQAISATDEPGMRKLIVGMLTKDAWSADDAETPSQDSEAELSEANIKAVLRWTFDIDLRD